MKLLKALMFISLLIACNSSEFNNINQAKNEINSDGNRIGKWVDYFDIHYKRLDDSANHVMYLLSEYDNGIVLPNFKMFYKSGFLHIKGEIKPDTIKCKKDFDLMQSMGKGKVLLKTSLFQDSSGKNTLNIFLDEEGFLKRKEIFYLNMKIDDLLKVDTLYIDYFRDINKNVKSIVINCWLFENTFNFNEKSWALTGSDQTKKEFMAKTLKAMFKNSNDNPYDLFLKSEIYSSADYFFRLSNSVIRSKVDKEIQTYNWKENNQPGYNNYVLANGEKINGLKKCEYCGRLFNSKNGGYQYNPLLNFGRKAISNFESSNHLTEKLMSEMGVPEINYKTTTFFWCSEQCVYLSGYTLEG